MIKQNLFLECKDGSTHENESTQYTLTDEGERKYMTVSQLIQKKHVTKYNTFFHDKNTNIIQHGCNLRILY